MLKTPRKFELEAACREIRTSIEAHNERIIGVTKNQIEAEIVKSKAYLKLKTRMEAIDQEYNEILELQAAFKGRPKNCEINRSLFSKYPNDTIGDCVEAKIEAIYRERKNSVELLLCTWTPNNATLITELVMAQKDTLVDSIRKVLNDRGIEYYRDLEEIELVA